MYIRPKLRKKFFLSMIIMFIFLLSSTHAFPIRMKGFIIGISDGDTVKLLDSQNRQYKIRLECIDAPEKGQDFGIKSKQFLSDMIFGKYVELDYQSMDRYGRIIGTIYLSDVDINLEQVKNGMAWVYTKYCLNEEYKKQENIARKNRKGLWASPKPIEPWEYRRK